jgi:hypothetical protein
MALGFTQALTEMSISPLGLHGLLLRRLQFNVKHSLFRLLKLIYVLREETYIITSSSPLKVNRCFGGICRLHLQSSSRRCSVAVGKGQCCSLACPTAVTTVL